MSLLVDKIKCVEESDEAGSDDIYLIVFQGRTVAPFTSGLSSIGPGRAWKDFDTGETHRTDVRVASTNSDAVYAVMMVEEDNSKDITGDAVLGFWRSQTDLIWKSIMLARATEGKATGTEAAKTAGFAGMRNALNGLASIYMEFPKGNDDVIDVERVTITQPGQSQTLRFRSPSNKEDATYNVTFKHTKVQKWSNCEYLGGVYASAPTVASWAPNRLDVFVQGTNNHLMHKWWNGTQWSGWEDLGGELTEAPAAVSWGPNRIDCFTRGKDKQLWHRWWYGGDEWSHWEHLGGVFASAPAVASWSANRLDVFVQGTNNHLMHKWWNGNQWSGWEDLGGELTEAPAAVSWGPNRIDCFTRGKDKQLWHKWWNGNQWSHWEHLGGVFASAPAVASWSANRLDVFVQGTNNHLMHRWWDGNQWSSWEDLGCELTEAPAAVSWGPNRIDCFIRGKDKQLWHKWTWLG